MIRKIKQCLQWFSCRILGSFINYVYSQKMKDKNVVLQCKPNCTRNIPSEYVCNLLFLKYILCKRKDFHFVHICIPSA